MKIQIRRGLFETNSSSVHTITMCTDNEWQEWKDGKLCFDIYHEKLVPTAEDQDKADYLSFDDFFTYDYLEPYAATLNGIHAFGRFGFDG